MNLEIQPNGTFNYINSFGNRIGAHHSENHLVIPPSLGTGTIQKFDLSSELVVLLHKYRLNEQFVLTRKAPEITSNRITMLFYRSAFPGATDLSTDTKRLIQGPILGKSAIEISANNLNSTVRFPTNSDIEFVVIGITTSLLNSYFSTIKNSLLVSDILHGLQSRSIYHNTMVANVSNASERLWGINTKDILGDFYFKLKVEELLYQLFSQLVKDDRPCGSIDQVNKSHVVEGIKAEITRDLSKRPVLAKLATQSGLSETQMKLLFKRAYGDTIYNHFQKARMDEAAFLLQHTHLAVSDVADSLGFQNLSHFTRLFNKHYHQNPKKYSSVRSD